MDISPFDVVDPLAIGVTDNSPQSPTPGLRAVGHQLPRRRRTRRTRRATTRTRGRISRRPTSPARTRSRPAIDFAWAERGAWTGSVVPYSYSSARSPTTAGAGIPVPTTVEPAVGRLSAIRWPAGQRRPDRRRRPTYNSSQLLSDVRERQDRREGGAVRPGPVDDEPRHAEPRAARWTGSIPACPRYHLVSVDHHAEPQLRRADVRDRASEGLDAEGGRRRGTCSGDGKTALKVNFAKYVLGQSLVASNPLIALSPFNVVAHGDASVDGQQRQLHPGLRPHQSGRTGSDGRRQPAAGRHLRRGQPAVLQGADRTSNVDPATGQLVPATTTRDTDGASGRTAGSSRSAPSASSRKGISVNGGYFRRWFGNFLVTDDLIAHGERLRSVQHHAER